MKIISKIPLTSEQFLIKVRVNPVNESLLRSSTDGTDQAINRLNASSGADENSPQFISECSLTPSTQNFEAGYAQNFVKYFPGVLALRKTDSLLP